jgi:hypothetical protein
MNRSFDYIEYAFTEFSESHYQTIDYVFPRHVTCVAQFRVAVIIKDMTTSRLRFHKVKGVIYFSANSVLNFQRNIHVHGH